MYSHHSTGLGHLVRSLAIAGAVAEGSDVVLVSGGRVPSGMAAPHGVELVALPPIGTDGRGALASLDRRYTLEQAWACRRRTLLDCFEGFDPDAVVVELFPFGRRKFAGEIVSLLERARQGRRRTVVSSVRDVLVDAHPDKQRHDDEAAARLDAHFDAVIVHGDPRVARLEETFRPSFPPAVPVFYSGFVAPASPVLPADRRPAQMLVSAGGGLVGGPLLEAAVEAHRSVLGPLGATTRVVTGPFLPSGAFARLVARARGVDGLTVERFVPDLASAMAASAVSVSQCGYNTSVDLLRAGVPAVVVPYDGGRETEQRARAGRLESLGVVRVLPAARLSPGSLAEAALDATTTRTRPAALDLGGAAATAALIDTLVRTRATSPARPAGAAGPTTRPKEGSHVTNERPGPVR